MARLMELYKKDIAKAMAEKFNYDNPMAIPKLTRRLALDGRCPGREIGEFGSLSDIAMIRKPMEMTRTGMWLWHRRHALQGHYDRDITEHPRRAITRRPQRSRSAISATSSPSSMRLSGSRTRPGSVLGAEKR